MFRVQGLGFGVYGIYKGLGLRASLRLKELKVYKGLGFRQGLGVLGFGDHCIV